MQFETEIHHSCLWEKVGKFAAFIVFSGVLFFITSKAGKICWSLNNYVKFAIAFAVGIFVVDNLIRRINGREKNKIVS